MNENANELAGCALAPEEAGRRVRQGLIDLDAIERSMWGETLQEKLAKENA